MFILRPICSHEGRLKDTRLKQAGQIERLQKISSKNACLTADWMSRLKKAQDLAICWLDKIHITREETDMERKQKPNHTGRAVLKALADSSPLGALIKARVFLCRQPGLSSGSSCLSLQGLGILNMHHLTVTDKIDFKAKRIQKDNNRYIVLIP